MDGWGLAETWGGNAVSLADKPTMDFLASTYPNTTLKASGEAVGLPYHEPGNSEVGHQNIGSGELAKQDLSSINKAIEDKSFFANPVLKDIFYKTAANNSVLHLIGLLSEGGIHSHISHLFALLETAKESELKKIAIHVITDGRDCPPTSGLSFIQKLEEKIKELDLGEIVSVSGRYYAMDRDNNWDRVQKFYDVITGSAARISGSIEEIVRKSYANGITDEFIEPVLLKKGLPITNRDSVIFFNYRSDRMRQIARTLTQKSFTEFKREIFPQSLVIGTFASYQDDLPVKVIFRFNNNLHPLASILSNRNISHLHAAETEKYAHVTYFFNGGVETPYKGEERIMVPSPRVKTYDLKPEMSAKQLTDKVLSRLLRDHFDLTILNFANPDMVGHTGNMEATMKAVETVDGCLGHLIKKLPDDYTFLVTADHGNAEQMINPVTALPDTEHTNNPVPFIFVNKKAKGKKLEENGKLCDIAPTILDLFDIEKPSTMNGHSLLK